MPSINTFKNQLRDGGSRANQFEVVIPRIGEQRMLCKATSLPGQTITEIDVNFRGRHLYVAGDREWETWNTTFYVDRNMNIRNHMEVWMNEINDVGDSSSLHDGGYGYMSDITVRHLDHNNHVTKAYNMINAWPTTITPIELDYDSTSAIETFDVTWRFTSWVA